MNKIFDVIQTKFVTNVNPIKKYKPLVKMETTSNINVTAAIALGALFFLILAVFVYAVVVANSNTSTTGGSVVPSTSAGPSPSPSSGPGPVITNGANFQRMYRDRPDPGNHGETFYIPVEGVTSGLTQIRVRFDLPFASDTLMVRFWRYRRDQNNNFTYSLITDPVTFNNTYLWSQWHDISHAIRDVDLDWRYDAVAVTFVYTTNGTPNVRAFQVTFSIDPKTTTTFATVPSNPAMTFPPA